MNLNVNKPIILFDGVCNLCESSVKFIIKRDKKAHFVFTSQQSDVGRALMLQYDLKKNDVESVLLVEAEKVYIKSEAALKIVKKLDGWVSVLYIFKIIPKPIRDYIYFFVAKNRYKWFGKKNSCMIPSKNIQNRFIDLF